MYFMGDYDCFNHIIVGLSWDVKTTRFSTGDNWIQPTIVGHAPVG